MHPKSPRRARTCRRARLPSTLNSTRETPTLSEAVAAEAREPETVAPEAGAVIETEGAVVSDGRRGVDHVEADALVGVVGVGEQRGLLGLRRGVEVGAVLEKEPVDREAPVAVALTDIERRAVVAIRGREVRDERVALCNTGV